MSFTTLVALAAIATSGDAVLVQFASEACRPCQAMQPAVSRLVSDGYPVQRIDVDRFPETARQFGVKAVPTFVLLVGNQEAGRIEGPTSYDRLAAMFTAAGPRQAVATVEPANPPAAAVQPTDFRSQFGGSASCQQAALAASVRLKVEDAAGYGFGTGTIIDTHGDEALIVTCGHLFRESQGKGRISVDLFAPGGPQEVPGELLACDLNRDIALVGIKPGVEVTPAAVAPAGFVVQPQDRVFSVGCDKGADATVRDSQITAVNKYHGKPNFTAKGAPIDGRSGGGLFTAQGLLIGICNAADPQDDEGLYAGLASIHWQLDQIGQTEIYQRQAGHIAAAAAGRGPGATADAGIALASAELPLAHALPAAPPSSPAGMPSAGLPPGWTAGQPAQLGESGRSPVAGSLDDDTELVVIIRSKRNPQTRSEIYVVDQASPELLTGIVHAARQGAQQRTAALAARQPSAAMAPLPPDSPFPRGSQPVVRAQSAE
ncbi:MAG TPA: trypsin-like peptidase domain-containing protein [Pirellulaceae bacterium]|nr:trypsin-like peptidase domain-containing protein [Pirellulaceae bacterium]